MKGTSVDAIMLTLVRVVTMLLGLACVKVVSVYFSIEEFGLYSQAMLIVSTTSSLIVLGFTDGVNYFFNSEKARAGIATRSQYLSTIFTLETIIGTAAGVLILAGSPFLTRYFENPAMGPTYIWVAFQPLFQTYMAMFGVLYISLGKTRWIVVFNLLFAIFRLGIFLIATLHTGEVLTLIQLTLVLDVAQVVAFLWMLRGQGVGLDMRKFTRKLCKPIFKYCIPVAMFVVINSLLRDCDKWVIGRLGGTDDLALYTNASRILPFDMMMASFTTVLIPVITRYASSTPRRAAEIVGEYLNLGLFTTTIFVGAAIWLSRDLMLTLYDAKYLPGIGVFIVFLLVDLVRFANVSLIFSATGRTRQLLEVIGITLVVNLVGAIVLFKVLGILGPAVATLLSMLMCNLLYIHKGSKVLDTPLFGLLGVKRFMLIVMELVVIGGAIATFGDNILSEINAIIRFVVLYALIVGIVGLLNRKPVMACMRNLNRAQ